MGCYGWLIHRVLLCAFRFHKMAAKFGALSFLLYGVIKKFDESELQTNTEMKKNYGAED